MKKPRIGFVGLGIMGSHMASHITKAGYPLIVHDIIRYQAEKLADSNPQVRVADTPKMVANASDIVITMLPSGKHVQEVTFGKSGLVEGFEKGNLLLDTSSSETWLTIETAKRLEKKGVDLIDAPVSGAEPGARSAELVFMVGGEKGPVSRVAPLFEIMGKQVFHLGPVGAGHTMKCVNNLITAMTFMATAEGLTIGKRYGLDPDIMTDVLNVSTGMSWISQTHIRQRITNRKFDDAFKLDLMIKDINIAMELAGQEKLPLPLSAVGQQIWKASTLFAGEGKSISEMVRWVEHMTQTKIVP